MSKQLKLLAALAWLCCAGCGPDLSHLPKTVSASGVVTLDGKPVELASVMFIADSGNFHATGNTDSSGRFTLKAFEEKPGAVPGSYKIEVNKTLVGNEKEDVTGGETTINLRHGLPAKYATFITSGLKYTIPDSDVSDIKLELVSKK